MKHKCRTNATIHIVIDYLSIKKLQIELASIQIPSSLIRRYANTQNSN